MPTITVEDMLKWLDVQHAAAVDKLQAMQDGEENHIERSEAATDMRIINAIKERVQELTAAEYLEAHQKMCVEYLNTDDFPISACAGCPLENPYCNCKYFELHYHRQAVEIVKRWKEERDGND